MGPERRYCHAAIGTLNKYVLPRQLFPNGYALAHAPRSAFFWRDPVWAHANWLQKSDNKRRFMEEHDLWLVHYGIDLPACVDARGEDQSQDDQVKLHGLCRYNCTSWPGGQPWYQPLTGAGL